MQSCSHFFKQVSQIYPMELEFMDMGYQTGVLGPKPANVQPFNELICIYA